VNRAFDRLPKILFFVFLGQDFRHGKIILSRLFRVQGILAGGRKIWQPTPLLFSI
jgi:hypothetical protein